MSLFHSRLQKRFRWARMYVLTSFFERTFCLGGGRRPTVPPRLGRRGPAVSLPTRRRPPPFFSSGLRRTCFSPVAFKMFLVTTVLERFGHGVVSPRAPCAWIVLGSRISGFAAFTILDTFRSRPRRRFPPPAPLRRGRWSRTRGRRACSPTRVLCASWCIRLCCAFTAVFSSAVSNFPLILSAVFFSSRVVILGEVWFEPFSVPVSTLLRGLGDSGRGALLRESRRRCGVSAQRGSRLPPVRMSRNRWADARDL